MSKSDDGLGVGGAVGLVGVGVLLIGGAVALAVMLARAAPEAVVSIEDRMEVAERDMRDAEEAFEREAVAEDAARAPVGGRVVSEDDGTLTPAEVAPVVRGRVVDANAGILGVWLEIPEFAPKPVRFDRSSDSVTILFGGASGERAVPLGDLFTGGVYAIAPGRSSAEHRATIPEGFRGDAVVTFTHVSKTGGRTVVTERVAVY